MEFKHSLSLLFSNVQYILKLFLYLVLCVLIVGAIGAAIIVPIGKACMTIDEVNVAVQALGGAITNYIGGDINLRGVYAIAFGSIIDFVQASLNYPGATAAIILVPIFMYFLYSFLVGISQYPMADIVNSLMSSNLKFGLASNIALNFKRALTFSASRMLVTFPIDVCLLAILGGTLWGLNQLINIFAVPIVLVLYFIAVSFRSLLMSGWLPRMLYHPKEQPFMAFKKSMKYVKHNLRGELQGFILTAVCSYCLTTAFALPTYGLIIIIVPSMYYFILRAIELIGYYKIKGMKFYVDASTVIDTTEFGYRAELQELSEAEDSVVETKSSILNYLDGVAPENNNIVVSKGNDTDVKDETK